jgi:hypothetical protein
MIPGTSRELDALGYAARLNADPFNVKNSRLHPQKSPFHAFWFIFLASYESLASGKEYAPIFPERHSSEWRFYFLFKSRKRILGSPSAVSLGLDLTGDRRSRFATKSFRMNSYKKARP